jgi:hypothetical protein
MSLKAFHVVFILISTCCLAGFGAWGINDYMQTRNPVHLALGIGSLVGTAALAIYGRWFLRKWKRVSYL